MFNRINLKSFSQIIPVLLVLFSLLFFTFSLTGFEVAFAAEPAATEEANTGIVGMFGLNWKLFLAQLVNFGIVLFVLWKWVFGPLTKGLSERTAKIEASLAEAEKITDDRSNFDAWKNEQIILARKEANEIVSKAKADTEVIKNKILEDTKLEQEKLTAQAQAAMLRDKETMVAEAKSEIAEMIIITTEKILGESIDSKKHQELINAALKTAKDDA